MEKIKVGVIKWDEIIHFREGNLTFPDLESIVKEMLKTCDFVQISDEEGHYSADELQDLLEHIKQRIKEENDN